jgi:hypothetical protein
VWLKWYLPSKRKALSSKPQYEEGKKKKNMIKQMQCLVICKIHHTSLLVRVGVTLKGQQLQGDCAAAHTFLQHGARNRDDAVCLLTLS